MSPRITSLSAIFVAAMLGALVFPGLLSAQNSVRAYPAPKGEPLSQQFQVTAETTPVPVYLARIVSLSPELRQDLGNSVLSNTSTTSFASFDLQGNAGISVACSEDVKSAKILPTSSGVIPVISGKTVHFSVNTTCQLTLEINGNWINSLHLFVDPMETDIPDPKDPNVIYFGPGIHHVQSIHVTSGKTVYIAGGAIIYGHPGGPGVSYAPIFDLLGSNIVFRGRGIIDGSLSWPVGRTLLNITGTNIKLEGLVLRDACGFTMPLRRSNGVTISNLKIFGWRGNSDGMDICNSSHVEVSNCFLRTFDDLIVLKTDRGQGDSSDVTIRHCVLWNEFAHALSLGAELREPLTGILFSDCDIIHDKGREWLLRVYDCDSAPVKNVVFENIRIEEARRLMSLYVGRSVWSKEAQAGHIEDVTFRDIHSPAPQRPGPLVDLAGFDATHAIDHVQLQNVVIAGQPLTKADVKQNAFVRDVTVAP